MAARYIFVFLVFYSFGLVNRTVHLILRETTSCPAAPVATLALNETGGETGGATGGEAGGETGGCAPVLLPLLFLHVLMVPLQARSHRRATDA